MSKDNRCEDKSFRKQGVDINIKPTVEKKPRVRKTKFFTPSVSDALTDVPEAITDGERLPHVAEYSGIRLETLPVKGLKSFLWSAAILVLVLMAWELMGAISAAFEYGQLLGYGLVVFVLVVMWLGLRLAWGYLSDGEGAKALDEVRSKSRRYREGNDFGNAKQLIGFMDNFYHDKPQAIYFKSCIGSLPNYGNDREVIDHIDRVFVQSLDEEALRRIAKSCKETVVAVAMSPWVSLDMAFSLWRSMKMIEDVAQVYGMRPSLYNRYMLVKNVMHQLIFVGVTESVMDSISDMLAGGFSDSAFTPLMAVGTARVGQGMGAGIYTSRIGVAAMRASRPIEFVEGTAPSLASVMKRALSLKSK